MPDPLLQVEHLAKDFPGGRVLDELSLALDRGQILGIVGENGAGKSTFVKILAGIHAPTAGALHLDGRPVHFRSPAQARQAGIALVPQEFDLVPALCVYENVFLGRELCGRAGLLDRGSMRRRTQAALRQLESDVDPDAPVHTLSLAGRQMVELAKALAHTCRLLILDEPTTVLSRQETDRLFEQIRRLAAGGVATILISHRLREVRALCDRVLVLRDGRPVSLAPTADADEVELARRMVGRALSDLFPPRTRAPGAALLEIEHLAARRGFPRDVSLTVRRGEILGLAGLAGSGRTELAEALIGLRPLRGGHVWLDGQSVRLPSPRAALRQGISYLPEDRQGAGVVLPFGIGANVTLSSLDRYARPLLDRRAIQQRADAYVHDFNIRSRRPNPRVVELSGGNQQKVALAKCLDTRPRVLIVDEPTRGVDINAKREIYLFLRQLADQGLACLLISSEMEEIVGLADRVAVMREGCIVANLSGSAITDEQIILHATGVADCAPPPTQPAQPTAAP